MSSNIEYSAFSRLMSKASQIILAITMLLSIPVFAETPEIFQVEQFNPSGEVQGSGWENVYDPVTNSIRLIPYQIIDGMKIFEGDIVLGEFSASAPDASNPDNVQNGAIVTNQGWLWDDGVFVYRLDDHNDSASILASMAAIEAATSIRFIERTSETAYTNFRRDGGCSSSIGKTGGAQTIQLQNPGCMSNGTIQHEIFHALGVYHEQSRQDRDTYVRINFANIQSGRENNFNKAGDISGTYDYGSIMHYGKYAFSIGSGLATVQPIDEFGNDDDSIVIGQRTGISQSDIDTIQYLYSADLALELDTVTQVNPGSSLSVDITVDNPGNDPLFGSIIAKDVLVTLPIPNQSTYDGLSSADSWTCQQVSQTLECSLGILDRNTSTLLTLEFTAPSNPGSMQFDAEVSASNRDKSLSDNTDTVTVTITGAVNNPPVVTITSPTNNSSFVQGGSITFTGTATDTEDGNLDANIEWSSNRDGSMGTGASINRSNLSVGTHTITASVEDSGGANDSATRTVTVTAPVNNDPVVTITAPANNSSFVQGSNITFTGTATDTEDGNLDASIEWSSNRDGSLGTGASINRSNLSVGTHTITASVDDSDGANDSATRTVTVTAVTPPINTSPVVTISTPVDNSSFARGDAITFAGTASDAEDGNLNASIDWSSSRDGNLGTGVSIIKSDLSIGIHTITASVSDSNGATDSKTRTITVTGPVNSVPVVNITSPDNNSSFVTDERIKFVVTAQDTEDGDISADIIWSSNIDGNIGSGAEFSKDLRVGTHIITASVSDSDNAVAGSTVTVKVTKKKKVGSGSLGLYGLFALMLCSIFRVRRRIS